MYAHMVNLRLIVGLLLAASTMTGCSRVPPLAHTHPSADAAMTAVLTALAARDRTALDALALSEQEFKDHVWPDLPSARPERNMPFSYVWGDLRQKSQASLGRTLQQYGGKRFTLARVSFSGETKYSRAVVHREATVTVRDEQGYTVDLRVCGALIEQNGGWKVFSYVVDD